MLTAPPTPGSGVLCGRCFRKQHPGECPPVGDAPALGPQPARVVSFGVAIAAMRAGKKMRRTGWNGRGLWIRYVDLYADREFTVRESPEAKGTWLPFLAMKTADGRLVPWLASQTDMLAEDWEEALDGLHLHRQRQRERGQDLEQRLSRLRKRGDL